MLYAVIAAGGIGSRMGAEKPKQYITVGNKPIIAHTVQKFLDCGKFRRVIVLCPEEWCSYTDALLKKHFNNDCVTVIKGGSDRNETIMNSVSYIENTDGLDENTVIVTHDAARPFVTTEIIDRHIESSEIYDAIGTVIPATDTIIESYDGLTINGTPDRSKLYQCQTPQTFNAKKLKELYFTLTDEKKNILTDTCSVFSVSGESVHLVMGDVQNIKITYPYDLKVAEIILE
ncbi:MAG: 2-C-methyl-D-erythritol 4-phosphate cytidylyltransferase [Clostridia bacterium]|nr:2-C-methyl-D-erythritol 4-phosphate cytidylyltransferase [Clostridia bacterium]